MRLDYSADVVARALIIPKRQEIVSFSIYSYT